jgi:hypothetical protein
MICQWFDLKITEMVCQWFNLKTNKTVCQWFDLKTTGTDSLGLASKPVAMVSPGLDLISVVESFSVWTSKSAGAV